MEIFVVPGSGLTTAPRLAPEKSMLRYVLRGHYVRLGLAIVALAIAVAGVAAIDLVNPLCCSPSPRWPGGLPCR